MNQNTQLELDMPETETALIFDTETTGFREPVVPVEVAWQKLVLKKLPNFADQMIEVVDEFEQRYAPGKPIEFGAMGTHHILNTDVVDCPPASTFKLPEGTIYLIGHNVDFDWSAIGRPGVRRICTLALARYLLPEVDSHQQSALLYYFKPTKATTSRLKNAHSALADVRNCLSLLKSLIGLLTDRGILQDGESWSWEDLWKISEQARIPTIMPFGKHKGLPIKQLSSDYVEWLWTTDLEPYLAMALRQL
jgi:exodeoxyribonuclease X